MQLYSEKTNSDIVSHRRKKCDEMKPKCSDCQRLNLPCTRSSTVRHRREESQVSQPTVATPLSSASQYPEEESFQSPISTDHPPAANTKSSTDLVPLATYNSEVAQPSPIYQWLITDNSTGTNDETDHSSIADEYSASPQRHSPGSHQFSESNVMFDNDTRSYSRWLPFNPVSVPYSLTVSPINSLTNKHDQHLFRHYTQIVSRSLSIASGGDSNPFLREVVPLATESTAVMGALLALSAIHLKYNGGYAELVQRGLDRQIKGRLIIKNLHTTPLTLIQH